MPGVEANREAWDRRYRWEREGEEWSAAWGSADNQWYGSLFPRLRAFLPADRILEIAPGHGRWTHYLKDQARTLSVVDLSASCIETCRRRFAGCAHIGYHVNDGCSLPMIADRSVDFAFSYDSLVHVERDVMAGYLRELARVLAPDGVAFLHHSNLAALRGVRMYLAIKDRFTGAESMDWIRAPESAGADRPPAARRLANVLYERLAAGGLFPNVFWRGRTVSAEVIEELAQAAGLQCIAQEKVNWYGRILLDCMTTLTRPGSRFARPNRVLANRAFMAEAAGIRRRGELYAAAGAASEARL